MSSDPTPARPPRARHSGRERTWASLFIGLFLLLQMAVPLRYYLLTGDRYDERFTWRMFSPERMVQCDVRFRAGDRVLHRRNLSGEFHEAWLGIAYRGRQVVIQSMAEHLCEKYGAQVETETTCRTLDGRIERSVFQPVACPGEQP